MRAVGAFIDVEGVSKTYTARGKALEALEDIRFGVGQGEFVAIVGASGCGKSTLLKIVAGLLPPSRGAVRVEGRPVEGPLDGVGIVFQSPTLLRWRTVLGNVMLPGEARGMAAGPMRRTAVELLKLVGLEGFEDRYPRELSGGMQQRVALSRALLLDPQMLLMDEPFGALDAMTREEMNLELLRIWEERRKTAVFITHSIAEAVFLADRVVVMTPRPGRVRDQVPIGLPRPRTLATRDTPQFTAHIRHIREQILSPAGPDRWAGGA